MLRGNDPAVANGQLTRGRRVFCSDRGQREGCGKTFSLFFETVLPRHTFTAPLLWALLLKLLSGATIKAGAEALALPLSLEAAYGIARRLRHRLAAVRSFLFRKQSAPANSQQSDPLLQTIGHLQQSFAQSTCAVAAYQIDFQRPLMG